MYSVWKLVPGGYLPEVCKPKIWIFFCEILKRHVKLKMKIIIHVYTYDTIVQIFFYVHGDISVWDECMCWGQRASSAAGVVTDSRWTTVHMSVGTFLYEMSICAEDREHSRAMVCTEAHSLKNKKKRGDKALLFIMHIMGIGKTSTFWVLKVDILPIPIIYIIKSRALSPPFFYFLESGLQCKPLL
jgi:hypothetical protein